MAKILTDARRMCPELIDAVKALDSLSYSRSYSDVFSDYIDWLIWQFQYPLKEGNPIEKYNEKEQDLFLDMFKNMQTEIRKRVRMWTYIPNEDKLGSKSSDWYDPLGRIYESITSSYKSSAMGQFFTPDPLVNFMCQITDVGTEGKVEKIFDPACGSGRMGLAAATHSMSKQNPCWVSMNDLDSICTKMAAINMCWHGIVGEVVCMNGLDIAGDSFRFAYKITPILAHYPQEQWPLLRTVTYIKTKQDIRKQYVLTPITYEQTFLKDVNDKLLKDYEERKKIADEMERQKAVDELKSNIQTRMKGSLFEGDTSFVDNLTLPSQQKSNPKKSSPKTTKDLGDDGQKSLF